MMNETPEAALRSRIADLEQQLKLADEGTSRLAQRCLDSMSLGRGSYF